MERQTIQDAVDNFYSTRLTNDSEKVIGLFSEGARTRIAGAEDVSKIAHSSSNRDELSANVQATVRSWEWHDVDVQSTLVEGASAAVRYQLTTKHVASGITVDAECMDQFYFDDDLLITEMIEFVDTAKAEQLEKLSR